MPLTETAAPIIIEVAIKIARRRRVHFDAQFGGFFVTQAEQIHVARTRHQHREA